MSFNKFHGQMEALGFRWQPEERFAGPYDAKMGIFYKRIETKRACLSNEKNQLVVTVFDMTRFPVGKGLSLTVDITGEYVPETWAKVEVYGLAPEKFLAEHEAIQASLTRAWEVLS